MFKYVFLVILAAVVYFVFFFDMQVTRFATAFYYAVFEYKKVQTTPSDLSYVDSVREQAEVALAANFDPTLTASQMAIPVTLYSGNDSYLEELRARLFRCAIAFVLTWLAVWGVT